MCEDTRLLVCEHAHEHILYTAHLYGNMSVELKHWKLCNKLHTDTVETMYNHTFNLRTLLIMKLFTYKTSPYANCVIEKRVCMQLVT